ncbi:MAG: Cgl0159 family (beta/alpha)8-fold protein [Kineosporiaceae bacterium]
MTRQHTDVDDPLPDDRCVVLGAVPGPDPTEDLAGWARALRQPTVRGLVVGRALLYPPGGDVAAAVAAAAQTLHSAHGDPVGAP